MSPHEKPQPPDIENIKRQLRTATPQRLTYTIKTVTPMFGGGVEAGVVDTEMPVRATAIRGHLRFWWRMLFGANRLPEDLLKEENSLWGATNFPSKININIQQKPKKAEWRKFKDYPTDKTKGNFGFKNFKPELYSLFPAVQNKTTTLLKEDYSFKLILSLDPCITNKDRSNIEDTLYAWINFGGLGARTRRGCGSLIICGNKYPKWPMPDGIQVFLKKENYKTALQAWSDAVEAYQSYRQGFRGERHEKLRNGKKIYAPGRSKWPEPDAIRNITGCALKPKYSSNKKIDPLTDTNDHSIPVVDKSFLNAFPRAVLGLPINFHFADGANKQREPAPWEDPADAELLPLPLEGNEDTEHFLRMASPVITKPVFINDSWHAMIAILPYAHALNMRARLFYKSVESDEKNRVDINVDNIHGQLFLGHTYLTPMRDCANAIEGLINFIKREKKFVQWEQRS
ncbi:MAG: type III-B CRISPR module RAMP protein Cmr1 [Xanthomonadaceae bacterium]|jgi:CRISPR-associated protein Cmr1|nr:type III-B CRISPR module RAMP protein Cmr1 [Xanthomonadaceae bacterium]